MPINIIKHIRQHPSEEDGTRILVMRYWPRGVTKDYCDNWLQVLAPSPQLLSATKNGEVEDDLLNPVQKPETLQVDTFSNLYIAELQSEEAQLCIRGLAKELNAGKVLTLLCCCHAPTHCHRFVLKNLIEIEAKTICHD